MKHSTSKLTFSDTADSHVTLSNDIIQKDKDLLKREINLLLLFGYQNVEKQSRGVKLGEFDIKKIH